MSPAGGALSCPVGPMVSGVKGALTAICGIDSRFGAERGKARSGTAEEAELLGEAAAAEWDGGLGSADVSTEL
ncbi:hypothetical protein Stube_67620 [Streptomyces tubercidicus]|uniref:Uncharacterized protein n=1 Tax=Streptomyces tubercidicus TaxID=47759 RepID=A0A640V1N3_9ACTN|nr:hypothetical protein Stube_67620 [Streptomyces tubercidicus]